MSKAKRRLDSGAARLVEALQLTAEVRQAVLDGKPVCKVLLLIDELRGSLQDVEDAVGVCVPAALFE